MTKQTAYVINLDRRKDRWAKMQELWEPHFQLVRIPAVDMPGNGAAGCRLSHRMIAAHFLKESETIIVMEDDNEPTLRFELGAENLFEEAKRCLHDWDYINFSPWLDLSALGLPRATLSECASPLFFKTSYSHNTNMVMYNRRSLPLLNAAMKHPLPLDMFLGECASDAWVPKCPLAVQDDSPGDIPKPNINAAVLYGLTEQMLFDAIKAKI